jgi:hypothetical protein
VKRAHERLPLRDLIEILQTLCSERRTGTMFVHTDTNHSARIGMEQGRIVFIACGRYRGMDAIEQIKKIQYGKYSFTESIFNSRTKTPLLPTRELLLQLAWATVGDPSGTNGIAGPFSAWAGGPHSPPIPGAAPLAAPATVALPPLPLHGPPEDIALEEMPLAVTGERLYALIAESLALSIGPVASIVCDDYRDRIQELGSPREFRTLIMEIASDLGEPDQSARFIARAFAVAGL